MDDKIEKLHAKPSGGKEATFVPEHSLRDLFKDLGEGLEEFLIDKLRASGSLDANASRTTDLVRFICDKAPKTFATLVFSDSEHLIVKFYENGLDDVLLPVVKEDSELISFPAKADVGLADMAARLASDEASRAKHIDSKREKDAAAAAERARRDAKTAALKVERTFRGWSPREIRNFYENHQWRFMAPVFNDAHFNYWFAEKAQMPFWPSGVRARSGPFSSVEKWGVHRDHLPHNAVSPLSRCTSRRPAMSIP